MKTRGTYPGAPVNKSGIKGGVQSDPVSGGANFVNLTCSGEFYSPHSSTEPMFCSNDIFFFILRTVVAFFVLLIIDLICYLAGLVMG